MHKKFILLILLTVLINQHLIAENFVKSNKDSILNSPDLFTDENYLNITIENKIYDFDSAESILLAANNIADSLNETDNKVKALILLGHLYFDNGYFENTQDIFNEVLNKFSKDLSEEQQADIKHALGLNHIKFNNYDKAINLIQEALLFYEKINNKSEVARALKDIGAVYYYLGNEKSALENYQKGLIIYRELNDSDGIARSYNNIGIIFKDKGNTTLALDYLNRSLEIKRIQKNQYGIANTLGNIGDVYMEDNQFDKAIDYFEQELQLWVMLNYLHGIAEVYNYLGKVYIKTGDYDRAIKNLIQGKEIGIKNNFKQRLIVSYELLSEAYFQTKEYKKAFINLQQYNSLKDSVYLALTNQKIEEYITKYENVKVEKELLYQDRKIMNQRYQIIIILIVLIGLVIFLAMLIRQNRHIRIKSKKIQNINKELDVRVHKKTSELRIAQFSIDIALDAIFWMKKDGGFFYINNSACSMLGYSKQELNEKSIFDIVPEFSKDIWNEYWDQLKKKASYVIQIYYKTRMGNEIPVEAAFNFREFEGDEYNFVFSRNISERKISEEKLKNAKEKAERSDKLKSAFLVNMSHEIRTPMNAIIGFVNLLGDSDITKDQKDEIIELAQSSSYDLLNIIDDIIDISKIEADVLTINKSLNYVNNLITGIYKNYSKNLIYIKKENLQLKLDMEPNSDRIAVFTDQARFKQVMCNLINNAIKFTDSGEIIIGYRHFIQDGRKSLKFYVKDTGVGIPKEKLTLIFDRFNQVVDDRRKSFKGTGLGLAISKKLVDLLGGEIAVESREGFGSEFYFTLPYQLMDTPEILIETKNRESEKPE